MRTRKDNIYKLYSRTKDSTLEIKDFIPPQTRGPSRINRGKPFDKKTYMQEYKKRTWTQGLIARMAKVITHKTMCSSQSSPLCLKVFVTNTEDTVCLRCK